MSNIPGTVSKLITRYGQPCKITLPVTMDDDSGSSTISTSIRIGQKSVYNNSGEIGFVTTGLLPATTVSIQGATITVGGRSYVVVGQVEMINDGATYLQKVTLGNG